MEYENTKIINIDGIIEIEGKWTRKNEAEYIYNGKVIYSEPLFNIRFIEYVGKKIEWSKSERFSAKSPKIYINMYHFLDIIKKNGLPYVYNGKVELGKIFLLTEYGESNNLERRHEIYITRDIIKMGRNGIWKIKNDYINEYNENLIKNIQYGRSGIIKLY
jgi:hypothetical protein